MSDDVVRVDRENGSSVSSDAVLVYVNIGLCETNNLILDDTFVWYYQRAYVSMYVICLHTTLSTHWYCSSNFRLQSCDIG